MPGRSTNPSLNEGNVIDLKRKVFGKSYITKTRYIMIDNGKNIYQSSKKKLNDPILYTKGYNSRSIYQR